jgi:hypothetical protein
VLKSGRSPPNWGQRSTTVLPGGIEPRIPWRNTTGLIRARWIVTSLLRRSAPQVASAVREAGPEGWIQTDHRIVFCSPARSVSEIAAIPHAAGEVLLCV